MFISTQSKAFHHLEGSCSEPEGAGHAGASSSLGLRATLLSKPGWYFSVTQAQRCCVLTAWGFLDVLQPKPRIREYLHCPVPGCITQPITFLILLSQRASEEVKMKTGAVLISILLFLCQSTSLTLP